MTCKQRIVAITEEDIPESKVIFDEDAGDFLRFRIEDSSGHIISRAFPHLRPAEIDDWSDDKLRTILRTLCAF